MPRQIIFFQVIKALSLLVCSIALLGCGQVHRLGRISFNDDPPSALTADEPQHGADLAGHVPSYSVAALPSPKEIFDFHPPGAKPGAYREAFIIDPNDGPLTAYVRRTAAELRAFNAQMKVEPAITSNKPCGEVDVAKGRVGCDDLAVKSSGTPARNELPLR